MAWVITCNCFINSSRTYHLVTVAYPVFVADSDAFAVAPAVPVVVSAVYAVAPVVDPVVPVAPVVYSVAPVVHPVVLFVALVVFQFSLWTSWLKQHRLNKNFLLRYS